MDHTNVEVGAAAIASARDAAVDLHDLIYAREALAAIHPALPDLTPGDVTELIETYADEFPGSMLAEKIERLLAAADKEGPE